jgi:hypothetical protein
LSDDAKARHARAEAQFQKPQKLATESEARQSEEQARIKAVDEKTSRLKALRLARDAAEALNRKRSWGSGDDPGVKLIREGKAR